MRRHKLVEHTKSLRIARGGAWLTRGTICLLRQLFREATIMPPEGFLRYKGKMDFLEDRSQILSSDVMASKSYNGQVTKLLEGTASARKSEMLLGRVLQKLFQRKTADTFRSSWRSNMGRFRSVMDGCEKL